MSLSDKASKYADIGFPLVIAWQLVLNLTGKSSETTRLHGDKFTSEGFVCVNRNQRIMIQWAKMELFLYFGDFKQAADQALEMGDRFAKIFPNFVMIMKETFHRGVSLYVMARWTRERKYIKEAQQVLTTVKAWVKAGNPNVQHYLLLLSAEQSAFNRNYELADAQFVKAITMAARFGYIQDAALFNELYADFRRQGGPRFAITDEEVKHRTSEAIRYYDEWGASAVAKRLREAKKRHYPADQRLVCEEVLSS